VRAAAEAAHSAAFPFTLTARAENFIAGRTDLRDTIARLQAFQGAGADVLFAPGLRTRQEITTVIQSVDRPVNVIMGLEGAEWSLQQLSEMGARRVSVGSSLARAALGTLLGAAEEMRSTGTFTFAQNAPKSRDIVVLFAGKLRSALTA
jgi:2-methylisocitrate lyase-like PEP mutase family enzyme